MCLIIYKPALCKLPDEDVLEMSFLANPDGAGVMWSDGKKVYIEKGFLDVDSLLTFLSTDDAVTCHNVVIHFRIATAGMVDVKNCHPFPVASDMEMFKYTSLECETAFAHNGILHGPWSKSELKTWSDTALFVRDVVSERPSDTVLEIIALNSSSRFALMSPDSIRLFGDWKMRVGDDCYYSNLYFELPPQRFGNYAYGHSNSYSYRTWRDRWSGSSNEVGENETDPAEHYCDYCDRLFTVDELIDLWSGYVCDDCIDDVLEMESKK